MIDQQTGDAKTKCGMSLEDRFCMWFWNNITEIFLAGVGFFAVTVGTLYWIFSYSYDVESYEEIQDKKYVGRMRGESNYFGEEWIYRRKDGKWFDVEGRHINHPDTQSVNRRLSKEVRKSEIEKLENGLELK